MRTIAWVGLASLIVIAGACTTVNFGKQPQPFLEGSQSEQWLEPGDTPYQTYKETFVDKSRPTNANGNYEGDSVRRLKGRVWAPESSYGGPYPLIVYSHGFSSSRRGGDYLAELLSSRGYVVVAVDYPLTNYLAPGRPNVKDVVNQPADISFLISTLIEQSATQGHPLEGLIDAQRIGVTGLSLGGLTSTLIAYHPTMRDERVGAALSIAGPTALFTPVFFSGSQIPFLMLAGDIDALVPYASNAAPVLTKVPGAQLVSIQGGSHSGFSGPAAPLRWMENPDYLGCYMVKKNIDESLQEPWYDLIGTVEQGIDHSTVNELCKVDPLPEATNVLRQQMITAVVVHSFFESIFSSDSGRREAAQAYLSQVLARELSDVTYQRATLNTMAM